jgi:hypothetical protein
MIVVRCAGRRVLGLAMLPRVDAAAGWRRRRRPTIAASSSAGPKAPAPAYIPAPARAQPVDATGIAWPDRHGSMPPPCPLLLEVFARDTLDRRKVRECSQDRQLLP